MRGLPTLRKAKENLRAARFCQRRKYYNATANRAYYAIFQAVQLLLEKRGIVPPTGPSCIRCGQPRNVNRQGRVGRWPHGPFLAHGLMGLSHESRITRFRSLVTNAYTLRSKADYEREPVSAQEAKATCGWAEEVITWVRSELGGLEE